ncbi:MAG: hypothetical protein R2822_14515 [Spirosomataceae bacterium]
MEKKLLEWPAAKASETTPSVMILNTVSKAEKATTDARYQFLDKAYGNK